MNRCTAFGAASGYSSIVTSPAVVSSTTVVARVRTGTWPSMPGSGTSVCAIGSAPSTSWLSLLVSEADGAFSTALVSGDGACSDADSAGAAVPVSVSDWQAASAASNSGAATRSVKG